MSWHTLLAGLVDAVADAAEELGHRTTRCLSAGEPPEDCADPVSVIGWLTGIDNVAPGQLPCVVQGSVTADLRVQFCPPDDPCAGGAAWDALMETAWCALAEEIEACCRDAVAEITFVAAEVARSDRTPAVWLDVGLRLGGCTVEV